jgi:hypothetical protein
MAALRFLGIGQILQHINALTLEIFEFLPHLLAAGLIFFVGLIVARIVRRLVETVLIAANIDGLLARVGIGSTEGTVRTKRSAVPPGTTPGATRASLARAAGVLVFALIIIPVAIPGILSAGIFAFTLSWNEFIYALVFLSSPAEKTVPVGVTSELIRGDVFFWGALMAGALLGSIPVAIAYSFFVENYVAGLTGSVKG